MMKTGKLDRKVQTPGHKKSLSATQTPKSPNSLKKDSKLLSVPKGQSPQGYNIHMRNNSDLIYKSLYDALSNLPSQIQPPANKHSFPIKESIMMYFA